MGFQYFLLLRHCYIKLVSVQDVPHGARPGAVFGEQQPLRGARPRRRTQQGPRLQEPRHQRPVQHHF